MRYAVIGQRLVWVLLVGMLGQGCRSEPEFEGKSMTEWLSLLRNQDLSVRERASDALARHGPGSITYLRRFLSATDPTLRRSVVVTLRKIGPSAEPVVPSLLKRMAREEVALIRAEILEALADINPNAPGVAEEFQKRLRDKAEQVRQAARRGLKALKPPESPPPGPQPEQSVSEKSNYRLREVVAAELDKEGIFFGLVAEVVRESRRAAILWPAIKEGRPTGSRMMAFVFEQRGDSQWIPVASKVDLTQGSDRLVELLGGADKQRVVRPCGVAKDQLAVFLKKHAQTFKQAMQAKKPKEAMQAFEQLSKAFSFRMAAYTDAILEWLETGVVGGPEWKLLTSENSDQCLLKLGAQGKPRTGRLHLTNCADGYAIAGIEWIQNQAEEQ